MPSADFCLITCLVTQSFAIGFHLFALSGDETEKPRHLFTRALLVTSRSQVKQISPDKNVNFLYTAASCTVAVRSHGFAVLYPRFAGAAPASSPPAYASNDVLVHQLVLSSNKRASGFLQTNPHG